MTSHSETCPVEDCSAPQLTNSSAAVAGPREWLGLTLLALPTALLGLDLTLLHLALPVLASDLQASSTQALWIMDSYGFMIAGFLITMGTLGDRIGRRKLLMIGAAVFAIASVAAAFAPTAGFLIAARAALGISAATLMPSTLALIGDLFVEPRQRMLGFGIWTTMFALGMALGPIVGGVMLTFFWWGAAFLIAVPVVVLLLILSPFLLPENRASRSGPIDLTSVALLLAALLPAVYGVKQIAKIGVGPDELGAVAVGILFAVLFIRRQQRLEDPLLDLSLFASKAFSIALVILLFGLVAVGGTMLLVTQYLQLVKGYSPVVAGLWMGPPALAMIIAGIGAPLIARRVRPGFVVAAALVLSAFGYFLLSQLDGGSNELFLVIAGFSLAYLGLGTIAALGTDLVVGSAPAEKSGSASAMSETVQDLGVSLGIAILGSVSAIVYRQDIASHAPLDLPAKMRDAVNDSLWAAMSNASELPPGLIEQAKSSFVEGLGVASLVSAVVVTVLAVLATVTLRNISSQRDA